MILLELVPLNRNNSKEQTQTFCSLAICPVDTSKLVLRRQSRGMVFRQHFFLNYHVPQQRHGLLDLPVRLVCSRELVLQEKQCGFVFYDILLILPRLPQP